MASKYDLQYRDYDGEVSTVGITGPTLSAANWEAEDTLRTALRNAINGITIGELAKEKVVAVDLIVSADLPASSFAQREIKWLCDYHDTVTSKVYQLEVPTADLALLADNSKQLSLAAGAGLAFKTAFEDAARSPVGNTVILDKVVHVGRNI